MKLLFGSKYAIAMDFCLDTYPSRWNEDQSPTSKDYTPEVLRSYLAESGRFVGDEEDILAIGNIVDSLLSIYSQLGMLPSSFYLAKRGHGQWYRTALSAIVDDAPRKLTRFNRDRADYNAVAGKVYAARRTLSPFSQQFHQSLIDGLIALGFGPMMGQDPREYTPGCFAYRLRSVFRTRRPSLKTLMVLDAGSTDVSEHRGAIYKVYDWMADSRRHLLSIEEEDPGRGAALILHFLNPSFFISMNSRAALAFNLAWGVQFSSPGNFKSTDTSYLECLVRAQTDIWNYGVERFCALEPGTPLMGIYDKLAYVSGLEAAEESMRMGQPPTVPYSFGGIMEMLGNPDLGGPLSSEEKAFVVSCANRMI